MKQYTILQFIGLFTSICSFIYGLVYDNASMAIVGGLMGFTFLMMLVICSDYFDNVKPKLTEVAER